MKSSHSECFISNSHGTLGCPFGTIGDPQGPAWKRPKHVKSFNIPLSSVFPNKNNPIIEYSVLTSYGTLFFIMGALGALWWPLGALGDPSEPNMAIKWLILSRNIWLPLLSSNFLTNWARKSRLVSDCSPWKIPSGPDVVFQIWYNTSGDMSLWR